MARCFPFTYRPLTSGPSKALMESSARSIHCLGAPVDLSQRLTQEDNTNMTNCLRRNNRDRVMETSSDVSQRVVSHHELSESLDSSGKPSEADYSSDRFSKEIDEFSEVVEFQAVRSARRTQSVSHCVEEVDNPRGRRLRKRAPSVSSMISIVDESDLWADVTVFPWMRSCIFVLPTKNDRADSPPSDCFTIYMSQIHCGFVYPLPEGICEVLRYWKICPAQLHPNCWTDVVGHYLLCCGLEMPFDVDFFRRICTAKWNKSEDFVTLARRGGFYAFSDRAEPEKNVKEFFVFIKIQEGAPKFPTSWAQHEQVNRKSYKSSSKDFDFRVGVFDLMDKGIWSMAQVRYCFVHNWRLVSYDPTRKLHPVIYYRGPIKSLAKMQRNLKKKNDRDAHVTVDMRSNPTPEDSQGNKKRTIEGRSEAESKKRKTGRKQSCEELESEERLEEKEDHSQHLEVLVPPQELKRTLVGISGESRSIFDDAVQKAIITSLPLPAESKIYAEEDPLTSATRLMDCLSEAISRGASLTKKVHSDRDADKLQSANAKLKEDLQKMGEDKRRVEAELAALRADHETLKSSEEGLKARFEELEGELASSAKILGEYQTSLGNSVRLAYLFGARLLKACSSYSNSIPPGLLREVKFPNESELKPEDDEDSDDEEGDPSSPGSAEIEPEGKIPAGDEGDPSVAEDA